MEGTKLYAGETNSNYSNSSSRNSSTLTTFKIKNKKDITTYNNTNGTENTNTKNRKICSQQNNKKYFPPNNEHITDLSDSTVEIINNSREKLRTGCTKYNITNSNNNHTYEHNNNMKQNKL